MPDVPFGGVAEQRLCLTGILALAAMGLLAGVGTRIGYYSESWNSVMAARAPRELPKSRLPRLPRGLFLALLFAAFPFLAGWCPGFLTLHLLFAFGFVCCGLSTAVWLLVAFFSRNFSSELKSPTPLWLRVWNWANSALFLLLMGTLINLLVILPVP